MALYPNEMAPLQIDRALGPGRYLARPLANLATIPEPAIEDTWCRDYRTAVPEAVLTAFGATVESRRPLQTGHSVASSRSQDCRVAMLRNRHSVCHRCRARLGSA
jgi:hypothetical protein